MVRTVALPVGGVGDDEAVATVGIPCGDGVLERLLASCRNIDVAAARVQIKRLMGFASPQVCPRIALPLQRSTADLRQTGTTVGK